MIKSSRAIAGLAGLHPSVARRMAISSAALIHPSKLLMSLSTRSASSTAVSDPKAKAHSFLDALPGNNIITKTGWVTLGASLAGYAISNELYVVNEESVILAGFVFTVGYLSTVIKEPYKQWADGMIEKQRSVLNAARAEHTKAVQDRISSVSEVKDVVSVTKSLFELSRETALSEHEAYQLKQKLAVKDEIKAILDGWVRAETQAREAEQSELVKKVVANVRKQLEDPKFQKDVMVNSITEIETLISSKKI